MGQMSVWGSNKSFKGYFNPIRNNRDMLQILVTTNNIGELSIFQSWLQSEPELVHLAKFIIRKYWAINSKEYDALEKIIINKHDNVSIIEGTLKEGAQNCDAVIFCATSAGLETTNFGRIGIFADLFMFLDNNPCFDNIKPWNPCHSAQELLKLIRHMNKAGDAEMAQIYTRQKIAASKIFSEPSISILNEHLYHRST